MMMIMKLQIKFLRNLEVLAVRFLHQSGTCNAI